jgi:hypothetical protein
MSAPVGGVINSSASHATPRGERRDQDRAYGRQYTRPPSSAATTRRSWQTRRNVRVRRSGGVKRRHPFTLGRANRIERREA